MVQFNFNDMDKYKGALDDGFVLEGEISEVEYIKIKFKDEIYSFELVDLFSLENIKTHDVSDWEKFKVEVANLFLS